MNADHFKRKAKPPGAVARLAAAHSVAGVIDAGRALRELLAQHVAPLRASRDRALARRLTHDALRGYNAADAVLGALLKKPLGRKDRLAHHVLVVGITQLRGGDIPPHAAVSATVEACKLAGKRHLAGLVNGVLKQYQRSADRFRFDHDPALHYGYPEWWVERLRADWPQHWRGILDAGNAPPPLVLRVNRRRVQREAYLRQLAAAGIGAQPLEYAPDAVVLDHPVAVSDLPGFDAGLVSVQDAGAQLAADCLRLADGQRVLDACAAPGGKTCHVLERAEVELTALELVPGRVAGIGDNLQRLGLDCHVECADATRPQDWWDGRKFDRILIDAPCSSSGVVRRHPDVRWLRRASDLSAYVQRQRALLDALWPLLEPGGILVYATCSVFHGENAGQGQVFMQTHDDAEPIDPGEHLRFAAPSQATACGPAADESAAGHGVAFGAQILPGDGGMDGFYYLAVRRRLR